MFTQTPFKQLVVTTSTRFTFSEVKNLILDSPKSGNGMMKV